MAEMADHILHGEDCVGCGMPFMDDDAAGIPRYCDGCEAPNKGPAIKAKRTIQCPGCSRQVGTRRALRQHRAAKGH